MSTEIIPCLQPGVDPDDWFAPVGSMRELDARLRCISCPLYWQCQEEAIKEGIPCGTWGGVDEITRRKIWQRTGG